MCDLVLMFTDVGLSVCVREGDFYDVSLKKQIIFISEDIQAIQIILRKDSQL